MTPRITDFGMAEVLNSDEDEKEAHTVAGTMGYIDPEYMRTRIISIKSDVYAFGVTILGLITAQHVTIRCGSEDTEYLPIYAWDFWSSGRAMELIDASLLEEPQIREILRCTQIAMLCVQSKQADRPTMSDVLMMLKCKSMVLPVPKALDGRKEEASSRKKKKEASDESSPDPSEAPQYKLSGF